MNPMRGLGGLIGKIGLGIRAAISEFFVGDLSQTLSRHMGWGRQTASGAIVNAETAMGVAAVYACVRLISGAVKNMPLAIKRRVSDDERQNADDHAVNLLLNRRPNSWMTPSAFKQLMTAWALLRGNGCALIVRDSRLNPISLLPLHPDRLEIAQLPGMQVVFAYVYPNGTRVVYPAKDVFHFMPFTLDGISGVTPITYARETIGLYITAERHGASTFRNGAHMGGLLKHPSQLTPAGIAKLRESLDNYRGAENAGKSLILEEGMSFETLTMTAEDAQYIETRKLSRSDIAMFYGVPPHMIGDTDSSTSWGTGIEAMSTGFVTYTLEDYLTAFEEAVDARLINDATGKIYCRFNRAALVRGDMKTRQAFYAMLLQWGVVSPNEVRALEDWNPRPGGDVYYDPPNTAGQTSSGAEDVLKNAA